MWPRLRFDITWRDLLMAAGYCLLPGKRSTVMERAKRAWSGTDDCLITLSVRSAFDLLLRALQLPAGSEVLFTALTVPDMVKIARAHGLVPVPVDIDQRGRPCLDSLRSALSAKTRMLVVAHLFGDHVPLDDIVDILRPHNIFLVEDCAQSFERVGDSGHAASDAVMYSFGPIKTASAMGGAVVRVASPELCRRMAECLSCDPLQSRVRYARRLARFAVLKALSGNHISALFCRCVSALGYDVDTLVNSFGRGFASSDIVSQIRHQPCAPLLRLVRRRWLHYDFSRIARRTRMGRCLDERTGNPHPPEHSFWVYPVFVPNPEAVRDRLRAAGFDATCQSRMIIVPPVDDARVAVAAERRWKQVVFLPWYPDLTDEAVDAIADCLNHTL